VTVQFVGTEPWNSRRGGGYEFHRPDGTLVYLHDTDLRTVVYTHGPPARLVCDFEYDPEWTPDPLRDTPLVRITFTGVRHLTWEEAEESLPLLEAHPEVAGQVSSLDYDEDGFFSLQTFTLDIAFAAELVEVTLHPRPGLSLPPQRERTR